MASRKRSRVGFHNYSTPLCGLGEKSFHNNLFWLNHSEEDPNNAEGPHFSNETPQLFFQNQSMDKKSEKKFSKELKVGQRLIRVEINCIEKNKNGAGGGIWTLDLVITNHLLYHWATPASGFKKIISFFFIMF